MKELKFRVEGSASEPYTVRIVQHDDGRVSAFCDCPAADNGQHCKHRIRLLHGDMEDLVGKRSKDVSQVLTWIEGSELKKILQELRDSEAQLAALTSRIARLKKTLARTMGQ